MVVQSMPDASPAKWHLAHTTWFFETFVLAAFAKDHRAFHPTFGFLFNSYYDAAGERHARPLRGVLTRPSRAEVEAYRARIDETVAALLASDALSGDARRRATEIVRLGLHHEQQHQELVLTDVLHLFSRSSLAPAYRSGGPRPDAKPTPLRWHEHPGGLVEIGHVGPGFAFDNETPRHRAFLEPFELASRTVTNAEFFEFIEEGKAGPLQLPVVDRDIAQEFFLRRRRRDRRRWTSF